MLLGLVHPSEGTATIGGRNYHDFANPTGDRRAPCSRPPASIRRAGPAPTCAWWPEPAGHDDARADEVLDLVGLRGDAKRKVGGFSMGMRQRLELATALIGDPAVLILDEPSNGLDPQGIAWLRDFMRYLAGEGRTVLVSSHLLSEMAQTIDDAVIMSFGQLKAQGTLEEITAGMTGLVHAGPHSRGRPAVPGPRPGPASPSAASASDEVADGRRPPEQVGPLLASNQIVLYELVQEGGDLESVFLSLTTGLGFGEAARPAVMHALRAELLKMRSMPGVWVMLRPGLPLDRTRHVWASSPPRPTAMPGHTFELVLQTLHQRAHAARRRLLQPSGAGADPRRPLHHRASTGTRPSRRTLSSRRSAPGARWPRSSSSRLWSLFMALSVPGHRGRRRPALERRAGRLRLAVT